MSQSLLKPGRNVWGIFADICRIATLLSTGLALVFWGPDKVIAFLAVFAILVIPRSMRMPEPFDAAFAVTMYISTLTGALGWYENLDWWDKVAHVVTTGAAAAMMCLILSRYGLVDNVLDRTRRLFRWRVVLQTTAFGLSIAVTWEILEWFYKTVNSNDPPATYLDTMADMLGGAVGSVIAAFFLTGWARDNRHETTHESGMRQSDPLPGSLSDLDDSGI